MIGCLHQLVQSGFFDSQFFQKHSFLIIIQFCHFRFDLSTNYHNIGVFRCRELSDLANIFIILACRVVLGNICSIDDRLVGQQIQALYEFRFILFQFHGSGGFALSQKCMHLVKKIQFFLQRFIPLQVLGGLLDTAFQHFHIGKDQLCIDGSISEIGSILPSTCTTLGSSKQRTTCTIAATSRIWPRNLLPRPSPLDAPFTSPAMS